MVEKASIADVMKVLIASRKQDMHQLWTTCSYLVAKSDLERSQERRCQSFVIEDLTNKHRTKTTCGVVSTWFLVFKSILKKHMIKFTSVTVSSYQYLLDV
ncbi:BnaCnng07590D [Brassica napus]|uniref:BnaCnng07590D protein n=1 Tax=Brassica napus TaxID=3708 RepID=A0A078H7K3_BRANA|nr:BnaCnng07590D [Brassica napus]